MTTPIRWFAIKTGISDPAATSYAFTAQKTMYGGKTVAVGDQIFIFASENEGGAGLFARGIISETEAISRTAARRQAPLVSISIERTGTAIRLMGRREVRGFPGQGSDSPEAELDFKLYRQATNKLVGLTDRTGEFLNGLF